MIREKMVGDVVQAPMGRVRDLELQCPQCERELAQIYGGRGKSATLKCQNHNCGMFNVHYEWPSVPLKIVDIEED